MGIVLPNMFLCTAILLAFNSQLSVAVSSDTATLSEDTSCPPHWVQASWVDMGCLLFNSTTPLTWLEANIYCQTMENSYSVEIQTEEQLAFLQMQLSVLEDHEGKRSWWTGATDIGQEGRWSWISGQTPVGDFLWYPGYPRNNTGYNCMKLDLGGGHTGTDNFCD